MHNAFGAFVAFGQNLKSRDSTSSHQYLPSLKLYASEFLKNSNRVIKHLAKSKERDPVHR